MASDARRRAEEALAWWDCKSHAQPANDTCLCSGHRLVAPLRALLAETAATEEPEEKLPAVVDRFGECLMCGHVYGAVVPEPVAEAARRYTKAVWAHEHCECIHQECGHMVAKRVAAYEVANAVVAVKGVKRG